MILTHLFKRIKNQVVQDYTKVTAEVTMLPLDAVMHVMHVHPLLSVTVLLVSANFVVAIYEEIAGD